MIDDCCKSLGVEYALSEVFAKGGEGGVALAETVCRVIDENETHFAPLYELDKTVEEKIETIAQEIYGADGVTFTNQAMKSLKDIKALGGGDVVSSPTFALVNEYAARLTVQHFDMYRVSGWDDLYSTGFFDYLDTDSVLVIEWSENIDGALPENTIRIDMQKGETETERVITIDGIEL